jgi:hypothetical protein
MAAADSLIRTTLQIDADAAQPSIEQLVQALRRVPGVLLAEGNAASARVIVAHDAGVSTASLLRAAAVLGLRAKFICDTRATAINIAAALPAAGLPNRKLVIVVAAIFVPIALGVIILVPSVPSNRWLLPAIFIALWAIVFAQMMFGRRR